MDFGYKKPAPLKGKKKTMKTSGAYEFNKLLKSTSFVAVFVASIFSSFVGYTASNNSHSSHGRNDPSPQCIYQLYNKSSVDVKSNIVWQRERSSTQLSWEGGKEYCSALEDGGLKEWRLPTEREYESLLEGCEYVDKGYTRCNSRAGNPVSRNWPHKGKYWTQTLKEIQSRRGTIKAVVYFQDKFGNYNYLKDRPNYHRWYMYVRCVHDVSDEDNDQSMNYNDCEDSNPAVNSNAEEICDGIDNDCDCKVDEGFDEDADGYAICRGDCNDKNGAVHPNAKEAYDNLDNNCDGKVDEGFDKDKDNYERWQGDCDDGNPEINPSAWEVCDGLDNECNGEIDDGFDEDRDGYSICQKDCDDTNNAVHPNAEEICDGLDNDCNGEIDEGFDKDGDGYGTCGGYDCNDQAAGVHPDAVEDPCDGIDNNCNGVVDIDALPDVTVGHFHACALKIDGTVICWGDNSFGQTSIPKDANGKLFVFKQIDAGMNHTCGVVAGGEGDAEGGVDQHEGDVVCWGKNTSCQSSNRDIYDNCKDSYVHPGFFKQVSAGPANTCAVYRDGHSFICWGDTEAKVNISSSTDYASLYIGAGYNYACLLLSDGDNEHVMCWGSGLRGYGNYLNVPEGAPEDAGSDDGYWADVDYGQMKVKYQSICGLKKNDTKIDCWGSICDECLLYNGPDKGHETAFVSITVGERHACGITPDNKIVCWGENKHCKASGNNDVRCNGDGTFSREGPYAKVSAGYNNTCAVRIDGSVECWGLSNSGGDITDVPQALGAICNHR